MTDRQEWIFTNVCGCPFGVLEFSGQTTGEAWREFYEGTHRSVALAVGRAVERGVTLELISFERYEAEFYERMRAGCPHD